jgi:hypothetical protein
MIADRSASGSHARRDVLRFAAASTVGLALSERASAAPDSAFAGGGVSGPLQSAGALAFGPGNVLFVGDIGAPQFMRSRLERLM